jgi:hypothetical protein
MSRERGWDRIVSVHLGDLAQRVREYVGKEFFSLIPCWNYENAKENQNYHSSSAHLISTVLLHHPSAFTVVLLAPRRMRLEVDHCQCCWNSERGDNFSVCGEQGEDFIGGLCGFIIMSWFASTKFSRDKRIIPDPEGRTPWIDFWEFWL